MRKLFGSVAAFLCVVVTAQAADLSELTQKLKDKDSEVRRAAAKELAEMGAEAKPAVAALIKALKDSDLYVRRYAAEALGEIGPDATGAVPNLAAILRDGKEKKEAQQAAALALGKIGPSGVSALIDALKDRNKDPMVRRSAVLGLAKLGPDAKSAIPTLVAELNNKDGGTKKMPNPDSLRSDIVSALGDIATAKDDNAISAIDGIAKDKKVKDKNLQKSAQEALKKIKARS